MESTANGADDFEPLTVADEKCETAAPSADALFVLTFLHLNYLEF